VEKWFLLPFAALSPARKRLRTKQLQQADASPLTKKRLTANALSAVQRPKVLFTLPKLTNFSQSKNLIKPNPY
jgi:hypothetical protein